VPRQVHHIDRRYSAEKELQVTSSLVTTSHENPTRHQDTRATPAQTFADRLFLGE